MLISVSYSSLIVYIPAFIFSAEYFSVQWNFLKGKKCNLSSFINIPLGFSKM